MVGLVKLLLLWYLQTNQNLKNYLLVLAKYLNNKYLNNRDIWYCENAICDKKGTYNIELVSNANDFRGVFGEVLDTVKDTFGNLLQLLTNLKNKEIEFDFHKKINYGLPFGIIFIAGNSDNPIDIDNKTKKLESCFHDAIKHPFYCPFTNCLNFQRIYQKPLMKYHNFLQTLKIQKSPMKKFHFRHQKIIHHYIKYMDILKEK